MEGRTIRLTKPKKAGKSRIFRISERLASMLGAMKAKAEAKTGLKEEGEHGYGNGSMNEKRTETELNAKVFPMGHSAAWTLLSRTRKRVAERLQNPRLKLLHYHSLRHFYATKLYHQTKDLLFTAKNLGHRHIESATIYIDIEESLYGEGSSNEFSSAVAKKVDEARKLIETGFDYVCSVDGAHLFRKRK